MVLTILKALQPSNHNPSDFVFSIKSHSFSTVFSRIIKQTNIEDFQLRDLRREGISRLLEMGLSRPEVAEFSGHKDLSMINNVYNSIDRPNLCKKVNRFCSSSSGL